MIEEQVLPNYAQRVGERLRVVRKQKRLSLQAVEASSHQEFKASVLGAYERGERSISVPRLQRLAAFYNVPVDQLLPRDLGIAFGASRAVANSVEGGTTVVAADAVGRFRPNDGEEDRVAIDLPRLDSVDAPERDLLRRYVSMIQVQRQDFNGRVLTLRDDDVRAIACLFDTTSEGMRRRLDELGLLITA